MSGPSIDNDAMFHDLPPLPAGWDWKRYKSLQPDEWDTVPDAEKSLIRAYEEARNAEWRDICGADEAARYRRFQIAMRSLRPAGHVPSTTAEEKSPLDIAPAAEDLTLYERAVVERFGIPIEQVGTPLFEIAEVMYRSKLEYWGFMVFRTCGYGSAAGQARWDEFWRRWVKMVNDRLGRLVMDGIYSTGLQEDDEGFETRFQEMYNAAMAGGILPRFRLQVNDYEAMSGWGPQEVRGIFREMLKEMEEQEEDGDDSQPKRVPVGVDWDLCLMVDEGAMSSLLDEREGRRPYIIGVLSDINDKEIGDDIEAEHFKIALESVVDLWRQVQVQHPNDLIQGSEGKIYISPNVFEDDD
ncbi:hypothetical protein QBC46DRAFT_394850 [Diplogelasinospora grovesii]|uniref:Uncharacterized protein n=1 Tax=Diplogelasinospora grovesii TaxID=303347 RepID=A0AAN6N0W8_9PEZI|nr:hypothetical protein QBC46DRAFT_394850 [Diplogelasinospora grovesii]